MATAAPAAAAVSFGATAMNLNILSHDLVKRTENDSDHRRLNYNITNLYGYCDPDCDTQKGLS